MVKHISWWDRERGVIKEGPDKNWVDNGGGRELYFKGKVIKFGAPECREVVVTEELRVEIMARHGYGKGRVN